MAYNYQPPEEEFKLYTVMNTIVTSIQTNNIPYFKKGYSKEVANILDQLSESQRYPLIYLPIPYKSTNESERFADFADWDLFIIGNSEAKYTTDQRFTNVYEVTLNTIYANLITAIKDNKWFYNTERLLPHERVDIPYANADTNKNFLNDVTDIIHLSFSNIEITKLKNY